MNVLQSAWPSSDPHVWEAFQIKKDRGEITGCVLTYSAQNVTDLRRFAMLVITVR